MIPWFYNYTYFMKIKKLDHMFTALKEGAKKRLIAVFANDAHTISAVARAVQLNLVEGVLVGNKEIILELCRQEHIDPSVFEIVHEADELKAAKRSVRLINDGKGDLIMKGLVSTDKYMRSLLDKQNGLLPVGSILSHVSVIEPKKYGKLLIVGDVAIIPLPEVKEKIAIANYLIQTARALGIKKPKLAVLAATEQVLPKMPACVDASILAKMGERGQFRNAFVDGPMGLDVAIDPESAEIKKIDSPVAGDADCLLFPNIESGNAFYKYHTKLAGGELAAVVVGTKVPAILSSRGDSTKTKLYSIALAALLA